MQLLDQIKLDGRRCPVARPAPSAHDSGGPGGTRGRPAGAAGAALQRLVAALVIMAVPHVAVAQVDSGATPSQTTSIVLTNITATSMVQPGQEPEAVADPSAVPAKAPARGEAPERDAGKSIQAVDLRRLIAQVARETGVAAELIAAVAAAESRFDPTARSPKGALGLMQLMPDTARRFGVQDVWRVEDNLRGGAAYLRWLLDLFDGDVRLAVAAYNAGEHAVLKAGRRVPAFSETRNYVPRVLAWREQYAGEFGQLHDAGATRPTSQPSKSAARTAERQQSAGTATLRASRQDVARR